MNKRRIFIIAGFALAMFRAACVFAEENVFETSPVPNTVHKFNVTTGPITAIRKGKAETSFKVRSEIDNQERTVFLKKKTPVYKNGKKLKKFTLKKGMRVRVEHNNFKGSSRQLVKRLDILEEPPKS